MTERAYNEYFKGHSEKMRTYSETPEPGCGRRSETVTIPWAYTVNFYILLCLRQERQSAFSSRPRRPHVRLDSENYYYHHHPEVLP